MHIVLVDNLLVERTPRGPRFDLQPHLGLLSLAAVATRGGHTAAVFDPKLALSRGTLTLDATLYDRMAAAILELKPDVAGFTTLGCNFICTLNVARRIRARQPDLPILLGGPHATILASEILTRFPEFDAVARHESEETLLPLLAALRTPHLRDVPGITYRDGARVVENPGTRTIADLDALPPRDYELYPVRELALRTLRVEAGRGCPFHCTFCSTAEFFGRKYRLRGAAPLVAELDALHAKFGVTDFSLMHDLFTVNKQKVREFCDAVAPRGYTWSCSARLDCVDDELLRAMSEAGCRAIYYGVETGSPRMQTIVQKRQDLDQFEPVLDATLRLGTRTMVSFITGYPEETASDQKQTLDRIGDCFRRDERLLSVQLHLLTPEPGTQLMRELGTQLRFDGHISDFNFPAIAAGDLEEMQRHREVFVNHHYFPTVLPRERHVFVTTLFALLDPLGFPLLARMVDARGGSFGDFVEAMYEQACLDGWQSAITHERLLAVFGAWWGDDHWLTSVARYVFTAGQLGDGPRPPRNRYRLSSRAAVCTAIPDCGGILERLARGTTIDEATEGVGNYLLVLDARGDRTLRNFRLDDSMTAFCSFLTTPRSRRRALAYARELAGAPEWGRAALDELARIGAVDGPSS